MMALLSKETPISEVAGPSVVSANLRGTDVVMIAGGIVEAFLGVKAEGQSLEDIAKPLTAEDAESGGQQPAPASA